MVGGGSVGCVLRGIEVVAEVAVKLGSRIAEGDTLGMFFCPPQAVRRIQTIVKIKNVFFISFFCMKSANICFYSNIATYHVNCGEYKYNQLAFYKTSYLKRSLESG